MTCITDTDVAVTVADDVTGLSQTHAPSRLSHEVTVVATSHTTGDQMRRDAVWQVTYNRFPTVPIMSINARYSDRT